MATKHGDLNIADMWEALSDIFAGDPALMHRAVDGSGVDWTWADFERDASRLAGHLVSSGLGPDSKVAFYLHTGPAYLVDDVVDIHGDHFDAQGDRRTPVKVEGAA